MKTCATCRHKTNRTSKAPYGQKMYVCGGIRELTDIEKNERPLAAADSEDGCSGGPFLVVLPTFGCVLYEEKGAE